MRSPDALPSQEEFYEQNEKRRDSHVLSYGSGWQRPGWTGHGRVVEVLWFGATHEVVAYYITYDWAKLPRGRLARDEARAEVDNLFIDSGVGIGRSLGDLDLATSSITVEVLGVVHSDIECHEVMWGWRWWQHHPDGLDHYRQRISEHAAS